MHRRSIAIWCERPRYQSRDMSRRWQTTLEYLWIAGSLLCLAIAVIRMRRFERSLRHAAAAPMSVQLRIEHLAERLGLSRAPASCLSPARSCPILWAVGRSARVLIPQTLWERLDAQQPRRDPHSRTGPLATAGSLDSMD